MPLTGSVRAIIRDDLGYRFARRSLRAFPVPGEALVCRPGISGNQAFMVIWDNVLLDALPSWLRLAEFLLGRVHVGRGGQRFLAAHANRG